MWSKATLGDQIGSRGERQSLQKHAAIKSLLPSVPDMNCAFTNYALTSQFSRVACKDQFERRIAFQATVSAVSNVRFSGLA